MGEECGVRVHFVFVCVMEEGEGEREMEGRQRGGGERGVRERTFVYMWGELRGREGGREGGRKS